MQNLTKITLLEIPNTFKSTLRGILISNNNTPKRLVLMYGGFERSATTENKFKVLADQLIKQDIWSFRFDYTGVGLSDGNFKLTTINYLKLDLESIIDYLRDEISKDLDIAIVAHSLSACAVLKTKLPLSKIIFIAPALNQADLQRYWFVQGKMKKQAPDLAIEWDNYKEYLDEAEFLESIKKPGKMTKKNYFPYGYAEENINQDYSKLIKEYTDNFLLIHGDNDDKVPFESLSSKFSNKIIIENGDHDLERPDMARQWINKAIDFISEGANIKEDSKITHPQTLSACK